jgi:hypothetical protein
VCKNELVKEYNGGKRVAHADIFGAMDPLICPLLNLAAWLEGGEYSGLLLFCAHRSNRFSVECTSNHFQQQSLPQHEGVAAWHAFCSKGCRVICGLLWHSEGLDYVSWSLEEEEEAG